MVQGNEYSRREERNSVSHSPPFCLTLLTFSFLLPHQAPTVTMIIPVLLLLLPQIFSLPTSRHDNTNSACNLLTSDHTAYDCLPDLSLESALTTSQEAHGIRRGDGREGLLTCPDAKNTIMYYEVTDWRLVKVCECWGKHQCKCRRNPLTVPNLTKPPSLQ